MPSEADLSGRVTWLVAPGVAAVIPIKLLGKGSVAVGVHGVGGIVAMCRRPRVASGGFRDGITGPDGRIVFSGGDAVFEVPFSVSAADSGVSGFNSGTVVRDQQCRSRRSSFRMNPAPWRDDLNPAGR